MEIVTVVTAGDRRAPDTAWGEGAFVGALEDDLLAGRIDLAVHSAKDVPLDRPAGLVTAAYPGREDPRDALVLPLGRAELPAAASGPASLAGLRAGARIGTDSPRRAGFALAARPDLHVVPLHGNVDTRLRRLDEGEVDALLLAAAGLVRLGRQDRITALLPAELVPPAPGQGALAVVVRADDPRTREVVAPLDDPDVRAAVTTERALLEATGGGCRAPVGALGTVDGGRLRLVAGAVDPDGTRRRIEEIDVAVGEATAAARALGLMLAGEAERS